MSRSYRKTPISLTVIGLTKKAKTKIRRRFRRYAKTQLDFAFSVSEAGDFDETLLPKKAFQMGRIPDHLKCRVKSPPETLSEFLDVYGK